jgi:hypothetical protein
VEARLSDVCVQLQHLAGRGRRIENLRLAGSRGLGPLPASWPPHCCLPYSPLLPKHLLHRCQLVLACSAPPRAPTSWGQVPVLTEARSPARSSSFPPPPLWAVRPPDCCPRPFALVPCPMCSSHRPRVSLPPSQPAASLGLPSCPPALLFVSSALLPRVTPGPSSPTGQSSCLSSALSSPWHTWCHTHVTL